MMRHGLGHKRSGGLVPSLGLLAGMVPLTVAGADFNFRVPVELTSMHPDAMLARVVCTVRSAEGIRIGRGESGPLRVSGELHRTVEIGVNAEEHRDANEAARYRCTLSLTVRDHATQPVTVFANEHSDYYDPRGAPAPGTRFVPVVSGSIER